jgi:hypothetical protein
MKSYAQKVLEGTANPTRDKPEGKNPVISKKMEEVLAQLDKIDVQKEAGEAYKYATLYKKLQDIQRNEPAGEEEAGNSVIASLFGRTETRGNGERK